ncbi:CsbD family protein [Actinacidiphila glaucinigra]
MSRLFDTPAVGKAKETIGEAVGNERLTAKGRAEQAKGDAHEAKEKVKDVGHDIARP